MFKPEAPTVSSATLNATNILLQPAAASPRLIPAWEPLVVFFILLLCPDVLVCLVMTYMVYSRSEWRSVKQSVQDQGVHLLATRGAEVHGPVTTAVRWIQDHVVWPF